MSEDGTKLKYVQGGEREGCEKDGREGEANGYNIKMVMRKMEYERYIGEKRIRERERDREGERERERE